MYVICSMFGRPIAYASTIYDAFNQLCAIINITNKPDDFYHVEFWSEDED